MKWLKQVIKQDIIGFILLCFIIGAGFIWVGSAYGWLQLSDGDKVNSTVLWLTALAIFWYAYEAYQLKLSSSEQAVLQEVIMQNEFLPILEPVAVRVGGATLSNGNFRGLKVRNLGKGPAKYVEVIMAGTAADLNWSLAGGEQAALSLPAATRAEVRLAMAKRPTKISLRIIYQDIYKRKFQTEHIVFDRTPRGTYRLREGAWDFKRLRT